MSTETVLAVFTGIVAVAFVLQSIALIGIRNAMRRIHGRMDTMGADLQERLKTMTEGVNQLMEVLRPLAQDLRALEQRVVATSAVVHERVLETDAFLREVTNSARLQVARIQDLVDTISSQIEETFEIIHKGVLTPATEVSAFVRGLKVAVDFLLKGRRGPSPQPHQDEEMFI